METREESNARSLAFYRNRRDSWIAENGPCQHCGSTENLEVDHIDPSTKDPRLRGWSGGTGNYWRWKKKDREAELAKCQVLCYSCHKKKTKSEHVPKTHCPQGHEFTEENTRIDIKSTGVISRTCRTCRRENASKAYYRKKARNEGI